MNNSSVSGSMISRTMIFVVMFAILVASWPTSAQTADIAPNEQVVHDAGADFVPSWLEPRALSVLDFVGQVPEEHLVGSTLVFGAAGTTQYLRGQRNGDKVTIEVSMSTWVVNHGDIVRTDISCLGRRPNFDEWPVAVPPSEMRVYSNGVDVTDQVVRQFVYTPAAQALPIWGSGGDNGIIRYHLERLAPMQWTDEGAVWIPANMGCRIWLPGIVPNITATFVFDYPQMLQIETVGEETVKFYSYVGVGDAGVLDGLRNQLTGRFGNRHEKPPIRIPSDADYVWVNYPPTPVSLYLKNMSNLPYNIALPFGGTYRFIGGELSNDHVVSMGLPLHAQWRDSDLAGGDYLQRLRPVTHISVPEYFVPPGIGYDPCMISGSCPASLLDEIYNTPAEMKLHYYRIRRLSYVDLLRVPLYPVGRDWRPGDTPSGISAAAATSSVQSTVQASEIVAPTTSTIPRHIIRLPSLFTAPPPPPVHPDDAPQADCPCGWFDHNYRMLDVIPGLPIQ